MGATDAFCELDGDLSQSCREHMRMLVEFFRNMKQSASKVEMLHTVTLEIVRLLEKQLTGLGSCQFFHS